MSATDKHNEENKTERVEATLAWVVWESLSSSWHLSWPEYYEEDSHEKV